MTEQRGQRLAILEQEKKARAAARELEKEQRATIKAAERREQDMRKKVVKLAVKELGKAVTRSGLRTQSGPEKEAWRALISTSNVKGRQIYREEDIREGADLDYDEIDHCVQCRLDFIKIMTSWKEGCILQLAGIGV